MGYSNPQIAVNPELEKVIYRKVITSPVSNLPFPKLKGNRFTKYIIRGYVKCETVETGVLLLALSLNGDISGVNGTDGNYRDLYADLKEAPYDGISALNQNEFNFIGATLIPGQFAMFECEISSKSGLGSHIIKQEIHSPDFSTGKTKLVTGSWDIDDECISIELFSGGGTTFDGATWTGEFTLIGVM